MQVRTGTSGFSYKPWKGPFYPENLPNKEMLRFYASRLRAVEINNTFYRMPTTKLLAQWSEQTPEQFTFALKAPRRITHSQRLKESAAAVSALFENAQALGPRLGPILFQLPPFLKKDTPRLRDFLSSLPEGRRSAFEFRHDSWFSDDVYETLRQHSAALCIADSEQLATPLVATAPWGYLRLRRDDYDDAQIEAWAEKIGRHNWTDAVVFFKHEDAGAGPRLAERLAELTNGGATGS